MTHFVGKYHIKDRCILFSLLLTFLISGCNLPSGLGAFNDSSQGVEINFFLYSPQKSGDIFIDIVDDVSGIPYHSSRYKMTRQDEGLFFQKISFPKNAFIKYRYIKRDTVDSIESDNRGNTINYRWYYTASSATVTDIVYGWSTAPVVVKGGKISGQVLDFSSSIAVSPVLVSAAGMSTWTDARGNYTLDNIPPGNQNLVVVSPDGAYLPFQQIAQVKANAVTQANINLYTARQVNVTFIVSVPPETPGEAPPVRLVGDVRKLGQTFTVMQGGMSIDPLAAPLMVKQSEGVYALSVKLPAGIVLHYKYTLGDGFWNAEHLENGALLTREILIPNKDTVLNDRVSAWGIPGIEPVKIEVDTPSSTPQDDQISVQLSPFIWMEPLSMQKQSDNHWVLTLFPPLTGLTEVSYRFCRNSICGTNSNTVPAPEDPAVEKVFLFGNTAQIIQNQALNWAWWQSELPSTTIDESDINPRVQGFITAFEIPSISTQSLHYMPDIFYNMRLLGANQVVITPHWEMQPFPVAVPDDKENSVEASLSEMAGYAQKEDLKMALFPELVYPSPADTWWDKANRDSIWWNQWFESYRAFALHYAFLAEQNQCQSLILGGPGIIPALPQGKLRNGTDSNAPADALNRWLSILNEVRQIYHGNIWWAAADTDLLFTPSPLLEQADGYYLLVSSPASTTDLDTFFSQVIEPFSMISQKPLVLALEYPASQQKSCRWEYQNSCWLDGDGNSAAYDGDIQLQNYLDVFKKINENGLIYGVASRGFSSFAPLLDPSTSVYGKPAAAAIWYWYSKFTGK